MNKNVMKKMMMVGAMCVALCGSSFAGANQKMVVHSDKRQVQQHQMQQHKVQQKQLQQMQAQQKKPVQQKKLQVQQQKHVVKQKQVVVVQKYDKCRHNRHDCRECYRKARPNQPGGKDLNQTSQTFSPASIKSDPTATDLPKFKFI